MNFDLGEGAPRPGESCWLVVCKACGFHVELLSGWCFKSCPACNSMLYGILPDEDGGGEIGQTVQRRRRRRARGLLLTSSGAVE